MSTLTLLVWRKNARRKACDGVREKKSRPHNTFTVVARLGPMDKRWLYAAQAFAHIRFYVYTFSFSFFSFFPFFFFFLIFCFLSSSSLNRVEAHFYPAFGRPLEKGVRELDSSLDLFDASMINGIAELQCLLLLCRVYALTEIISLVIFYKRSYMAWRVMVIGSAEVIRESSFLARIVLCSTAHFTVTYRKPIYNLYMELVLMSLFLAILSAFFALIRKCDI
jgi:hypothetical protein